MRALTHRSFVAAIATLALICAMALPLIAQEPTRDKSGEVLEPTFEVDAAADHIVPAAPAPKQEELPATKSDDGSSSNLITSGTYAFTATSSVALEDMSSGTRVLMMADADDFASVVTPIGFDFWYDGVRQTQFSVNANGLMRLGVAAVSTAFSNALTTTTNDPQIAPYWDDLWVGSNGKIHYKVVGTAPNRKLVVEWQNEQIPRVAALTAGAGTFQAWLFESTGVIEFVYGSGIAVNSANSGYTVGLATTATSFASVTTSTNTVSYAVANDTNTVAIAAGTAYTFTPNTPTAPGTLSFTAVGLNGMTLNWADTNANEFGYAIYRSVDGTNYDFIRQTAANATSSVETGLASNTTWFWKVVAVTEGGVSASSDGSQATTTGTVSGTISVGPTGTFTTIAAAVANINTNGLAGNVVLELQAAYVSSVETFPLVINTLGSPSNTVTIRPETGATALTITSANATATLDLNTATNVTIDGRAGGAGASQLTIINTTTTGNAVRFINSASRNTIKFATIAGVSTSTTGGVVLFSTSTGLLTGNNNNTIDTCDVKNNGLSNPVNGITSIGTSATALLNTGNTINNCNIFDFFSATLATNGILVTTNTNLSNFGWTISNNRLFQTASRTYTTANTHRDILVSGGSNHTISGNTIGFASSAGTGTYTMTGTVATSLIPIQMQVGDGVNNIQGNTIAGISLQTTTGSLNGIVVTSGSVNIGTVTGNTIGAATGNGSLSLTDVTTSGAFVVGLNIQGSGTGTVVMSNNTIGSLTATGSPATVNPNMNVVQVTGGAPTITNNSLGSATTANSIQVTTAGTSATGQQILGMLIAVTTQTTITGNTVANLTNSGTGTAHVIRGIQIQNNTLTTGAGAGTATIATNNVHDITGANANTTTFGGVAGILHAGTSPFGASIDQNTVSAIIASNAGAVATFPQAIGYTNSSNGTITRNKVCDVRNASTGTTATLPPMAVGILVQAALGTGVTVSNNMVSLGDSQTTNTEFVGLMNNFVTAGLSSFYNTVNITGSVGAGALPSYGFLRGDNTAASAITTPITAKNNIFHNSRTGGTGKHYAIGNVNSVPATGWGAGVSNNNVLNSAVAGTVGIWGLAADQTFGSWQTISSGDGASLSGIPVPFVGTCDLHLNFGLTGTPIESHGTPIAGLTIDIDNQTRPGPPGSVNGGGTAPDLGADEFDGVPGCTIDGDCNDSNPCTTDACLSGTCSHINNSNPCTSDGNPCTDDVCGGGTCTHPANSAACTDGNPCTDDVCSGGTCVSTNNTGPCDDGNPCTTGNTCSGGLCGTNGPSGVACSDGNPCTYGDTCNASGVCISGTGSPTPVQICSTDGPVAIRDGVAGALPYPTVITVAGQPSIVCTVTAKLNNVAHSFPDDIDMLLAGPTATNNLVIMSDVGGSTSTIASPVTLTLADSAAGLIPDAGPLVTGTFKPTNIGTGDPFAAPAPASSASSTFAASFTGSNPNGTWKLYIVDDSTGDTGTMGSWCLNIAAACQFDSECNDSNVCTDDTCVAGQCTFTNNSNTCTDGNACTTGDTCTGGVCAGGPPPSCDDSDACTTDSCNPGTGLCEHAPVICNDSNACTDDSCNSGSGCVFTNNDSNTCTDSNVCTDGDHCAAGSCVGSPHSCDDSNPCTTEVCVAPTTGCVYTNVTGACTDNNACTNPDVCTPPGTVTLSENFDGATPPALPAGWTQQVITGVAGTDLWVTSTGTTDTAPNKASTNDPTAISDKVLVSPSTLLGSCAAQLTFRHNFNWESSTTPGLGFDGGVLEIKIGAGSFTDIVTAGGSFVTGGYTHTISTGFSSPIAGRPAWSGISGGGVSPVYITTTVNLPAAALGQTIQLRWRGASDSSAGVTGWFVDSVSLTSGCNTCVSGPAVNCDDSNACTDDSCIPATGCSNTPHNCNDSDGCTDDSCNPSSGCVYVPHNCSDGNQCTTDVCISPAGTCDNSATSGVCDINGTVRYYRDNVGPVEPSTKGIPSEDVTRTSSSESTSVSTTNASGQFDFQDESGNVSLTPTAIRLMVDENECHNSITAADATQIAQASVNLVTFTTNQRIAGDTSNNGTISAFDAALTAQKAVAAPCISYQFPVRTATGSDWAFRPVSRNYTPLTGIAEDYTFLGILYGDVTGNWTAPVLFGQSTDEKPQAPSLETETEANLANSTIRIPTTVFESGTATMAAAKGKKGATLYVAGLPTKNADGTWSAVFGLQNADGILGLDMTLKYDTSVIHVLAVNTAGISSNFTAAGNKADSGYAVSMFGVDALAGSGSFLKVTYTVTGSATGSPFSIAAQANEGQIPISWSGVPRSTNNPQIRVDE